MVQNYNGTVANIWIGSRRQRLHSDPAGEGFGAAKVTGVVITKEATFMMTSPSPRGKTQP